MSERDESRKFFGAGLMVFGGLIATLCGGCSVMLLVGSIVSLLRYPTSLENGLASMLGGGLIVAIVGGLPTMIGVSTFLAGRRLYRPSPPRQTPAPLDFTDG